MQRLSVSHAFLVARSPRRCREAIHKHRGTLQKAIGFGLGIDRIYLGLDGLRARSRNGCVFRSWQDQQVTVIEQFMSNNKKFKVSLNVGLQGQVVRFDEDGDALIEFDGIGSRQWVFARNLPKLQGIKPPKASATDSYNITMLLGILSSMLR